MITLIVLPWVKRDGSGSAADPPLATKMAKSLMDDDQIDSWRLDWRDAVTRREARNDLLLSLSSRPMAAIRPIAWRDAAGDILALPAQAVAAVAPLPYSRLARVWIEGVRVPADIVLDENFRELTAQELMAWTGESLDLVAS